MPSLLPEETQQKWESIVNTISNIIEWCKHIRENIASLSMDLLTWSYDMITSIVLHTPMILFDNGWFSQNILLFTGLSITLSMVLAMHEGFKRMSGQLIKIKAPITDLGRISKRMPFVILGSGLAPISFYYGFRGINYLTNVIVDIGRHQMANGINGMPLNEVAGFELFAFIGFDLALIGMMIPIFLQNFRRWFDLFTLGVMTPLALSCWMFTAYEHHFRHWWDHIKKCSLVQLVYALFLLIIGSLMFGAKSPETTQEMMIKMGIVIGGLWRMNNPPNMMRRYLDTGTDLKGMWTGAGKAITPHSWLQKGVTTIRNQFKKGGNT